MIDTLVFDIGNVLVNWKPVPYLMRMLGCNQAEAERLDKLIFESREWKGSDLGEIDRAEIERRLTEKYPEDREAIIIALSDCDSVLTEYKDNTALLKKLKALGFGIYYLSNTDIDAYEYMDTHDHFFEVMDGGVASYREGVIKPSPEIYRIFLQRYGKTGENCLFIDDLEENITAAQQCGFNAERLPSHEFLEETLRKYEDVRRALDGEKS